MKRLSATFVASLALVVGLAIPSARAQDAFNLTDARVVGSPADVSRWPATGSITAIHFSPTTGLSFDFTTHDSWPDFVPPGWAGPIQYTVWACHDDGGQWVCAGFIQMWRDRNGTGAPLPDNWTFWWGPRAGGAINAPFGDYQSRPGDQLGFMLTAGNARDEGAVTSVRERTNVVVVSLPAGNSGDFTFGAAPAPTPSPVPAPTPGPAPVPTPAPLPSTDLSPILNELAVLRLQETADVAAIRADIKSFRDEVESTWKSVLTSLLKYGPAIVGGFLIGKK